MKLGGFSFHVDVKSQVEGDISDLEDFGGLDDFLLFVL